MKKVLYLLVLLALVLAVFSACGEKHDPPAETDVLTPSPVEDFEYELSESGEYVYITNYLGSDEHVVIPGEIEGKPVVTIKYRCLEDGTWVGAFENSSIKAVTIPDSVGWITNAFKNCSSLAEVNIGKNSALKCVTHAFTNCVSLERIDFSHTKLERIEYSTFAGCTALKEVRFGDNLVHIGWWAFQNCSALEQLNFPQTLQEIEWKAFNGCTSLKTVNLPPLLDLWSMDSIMFPGATLERIVFDDGRELIDGYALCNVMSHAEIIIPKSVKKISYWPMAIVDQASIFFSGDCPELGDTADRRMFGNATIYYDPSTSGWEDCIWRDFLTVLPMES